MLWVKWLWRASLLNWCLPLKNKNKITTIISNLLCVYIYREKKWNLCVFNCLSTRTFSFCWHHNVLMVQIITSTKYWAMPATSVSTSLWHVCLWVILGLSGLSSSTSIYCRKKSPQLEIASLYLSVFASPPLYKFLMLLNVGFFL